MKKITTKLSEPYSPKIGERLIIDDVLCEAVECDDAEYNCVKCILRGTESCITHVECTPEFNKHGVDIYLKKIEK